MFDKGKQKYFKDWPHIYMHVYILNHITFYLFFFSALPPELPSLKIALVGELKYLVLKL